MGISCGRRMVAVLIGLATVSASAQDAGRVREAFLAESADVAAFEAIAAHPELLGDRQVRIKILRSLEAPSPEIVAATVELMLATPDLAADPMLAKRFNRTLSASPAPRRNAILARAMKKGYTDDPRLIALISEAIVDPDPELARAARAAARADAKLQESPAVAEALGRAGEQAPAMKLPDFDTFRTSVQPVLEAAGKDDKRCSSCHDDHAALRLPQMDVAAPPDEQIRVRYRSALRVINLRDPEASLMLRKPTSPKPEAAVAPGTLTHGGDVRFEKGSPGYQAILAWIRTGSPSAR